RTVRYVVWKGRVKSPLSDRLELFALPPVRKRLLFSTFWNILIEILLGIGTRGFAFVFLKAAVWEDEDV
ncbi:MAG: hypothetical protein Q4E89_13675, partial [Eubacteriales bacterium]|nr:hypothetical protein [Eubacteriales bacterium]